MANTVNRFLVLFLSLILVVAAFWLAYDGPDDQLTGAAVVGFINALVAIQLCNRNDDSERKP